MAQPQDFNQTITSVSGRPGPILSAYLSVNADIPENQGRAYLVRLRDAMNDEGVPEDLQWRVREYTEEEKHPEARTLAIFADEDNLFEVYRLQVDVPESFRWGRAREGAPERDKGEWRSRPFKRKTVSTTSQSSGSSMPRSAGAITTSSPYAKPHVKSAHSVARRRACGH